MEKFPTFSEDLIKELDEAFPDKCPDMTMSDREIWFRAGQRALVNYLLALLKEAQEDDLLSKEVIT